MRKRAMAAVLALIFVAAIGVLAVAMMEMTTTAMRAAGNDRSAQVAMAAAESGLAYLQRQISDTVMSSDGPTGRVALQAIYAQLKAMNSTATLGGQSITCSPSEEAMTSISVPWISPYPDSAQQFSAEISIAAADADVPLAGLHMAVTGRDTRSGLARRLAVSFAGYDRTSEIFAYGVYARGRIDLADGKANITGTPAGAGSVGSAYSSDYAVFMNGGTVTGNIYVNGDPNATLKVGANGGSIGGVDITRDPQSLQDAMSHVIQRDPPLFPDFKPNQFNVPELRDASATTGKVYKDVRIATNMTFKGGETFEGLIFVKKGVTVTFQGNPVINAVIVVEDPEDGTTSTSRLMFQGVPTFDTVKWSGSTVPQPTREALAGYSVLGPTAYVYMGGNTGGDGTKKSTFASSVVCGTLEQDHSGIVRILDGTLITMADTMTTGAKSFSSSFDGDGVELVRTSDYKPPTGGYAHSYVWLIDMPTYREVMQ